MSGTGSRDVAVIGAGIVGLATARALVQGGRRSIVVLEAEDRPGAHQTGHNSGVIHSGLYYKPGSLKARNCVDGRDEMYEFCRSRDVPHEGCGKIVVAVTPDEVPRLRELERRGKANGLEGLKRLSSEEVEEYEPHARAVEALWVPQTGIVDFSRVAQALAQELSERDVEVRTRARVDGVLRRSGGLVVRAGGEEFEVRNLVNCAGLESDRVARLCGVDPGLRIVPFRGEYLELAPDRRHLVRNLIYPVPDPDLPFLGVHFTRTIDGKVEVGPNAVLALSRTGYSRSDVSARDMLEFLCYRGFWQMARRQWKVGAMEVGRSLSRSALARALRRMVPDVSAADLHPSGAGVRAQAVEPDGSLVDDFRIVEAERMLHVLNAPSPAATASLSIGRELAARATRIFGSD